MKDIFSKRDWRNYFPEDTVLKPIGDIAKAIENTSLSDLLMFTVMMEKQLAKESIKGDSVIIGFND